MLDYPRCGFARIIPTLERCDQQGRIEIIDVLKVDGANTSSAGLPWPAIAASIGSSLRAHQ